MSGRAIARIDLGAVSRNCARLRRELRSGGGLCAVVKANAYGHGAIECARAAVDGGADRLAVVSALEAREIAAALPGVPLLVLGDLRGEDMDIALGVGAEVSIWTDQGLRLASERARASARPARVHVKLDSGMGRLGNRDPAEVARLADAAADEPDLELAGIWTHFATADEPDSEYFDDQLARFTEVAAAVRSSHPGVLAHAANSAATLRDARAHFDFVRCGIAIYGLDPQNRDSTSWDLEPALSLRSYLADVKRLERGASVGYGRTWRAPTDTWVGVAPIGYGDGYRRGLSNNGEVLVGGRRRPVIGNVSMDNITIDLGPETEAKAGDPVVLIGSQGGQSIPAEELAARLGTINYEVTTALTARVIRSFGGR